MSNQVTATSPDALVDQVVARFKKRLQKDSIFYVSFALIIVFEFLIFILFLSPLVNAFFVGATLAIFFFTVLFFSIFRLYFEEEKALDIEDIGKNYLEQC